jgi:hypothetical protein
MSDEPKPSDARARREAELAEALRANLRRRKGPPAGGSGKEDEPTEPPLPRPPDAR